MNSALRQLLEHRRPGRTLGTKKRVLTKDSLCRRVSDVAQHALQHFHENSQQPLTERTQQTQHTEVLHSLLLWLTSYR